MIQRIQTVYLLLAACIMAAMFLVPLASITAGGETIRLTAFGFRGGTPENPLTVVRATGLGLLLILGVLIPLMTIFLYKRRPLQIRLCYVAMVLLFGAQALTGFYIWQASDTAAAVPGGVFEFSVSDVFPIVAFILTWLALRGIIRDEALVRSLDRIR